MIDNQSVLKRLVENPEEADARSRLSKSVYLDKG